MAMIEVDDYYFGWLEENFRPLLEEKQISITESAQQLLAFSLQTQSRDRFVADRDQATKRAMKLIDVFASGDRQESDDMRDFDFDRRELNFNVALHLMVDLNRASRQFPWGTTD